MGIKFKKGYAHQLAGITAAVLVAAGMLAVPEVSAQVARTKHNLSTSYTAGNQGNRNNHLTGGTSDLTQICVFCHTPHGAATDKAPLWQRNIGPNGTGVTDLTSNGYQTYSSVNASASPTMDSPTRPVGSVSVACLSCHDGTQAINTLANYAGSGSKKWDDASIGGSWTGGTTTADGKLTGMPNLGKDLQNDHPIGVHYGGGLDATNAVSGTKDPAFRKVQSVPGGVNGTPVWYVESSGNSARDKKDIQLFTRKADPVADTGDLTPYVECSSCHDPHMDEKLFLRVTAEGSQICLACHDK
ncbi:MAG TPA: cytochrome c3 family protein [Noviherbaspirillum sp.]